MQLARYANYGDVEQVIEGHDSCLLIVRKPDNSLATYFVKKESDRYEIGELSDLTPLNLVYAQSISYELQISVCQFEDTDDYYVTIADTSGKPKIIADYNGSEFYIKKDPKKTVCVYYAYVNGFDMNYCVFIDGQEYRMTKQE